MNKRLMFGMARAFGILLLLPAATAAHEGHAGDHGWLFGALQPGLSWDHLAAALFVFAVGAVLLTALGQWLGAARRRGDRSTVL